MFIYGGCNGNANNFEKLEDCRFMCEEGKHSDRIMKARYNFNPDTNAMI